MPARLMSAAQDCANASCFRTRAALHRLPRPLAQIRNDALLAQRAAGDAGVAAVQDQPVMGVQQVFLRHDLHQLHLDVERRLADRQAGAVADAEDVGIDRDGRLAEGDVEHDVGGLAADAGQRFQRLAIVRDLAAVLVDELLRQRDHVLRLGAKKPDGLDQVAHLALRRASTIFSGVSASLNKAGVALLTPGIGRLRREHDRDQERKRIDVLQFGARVADWRRRSGGTLPRSRLWSIAAARRGRPWRRPWRGALPGLRRAALPSRRLSSAAGRFPDLAALLASFQFLARCSCAPFSPIMSAMTNDSNAASRPEDLFGRHHAAPLAEPDAAF